MNRVKGGFAQSDSIDYSPDCYLQTRLRVYLLSEYPHNSLSNFRGTGNKREQPFRESYGRIAHIRVFTKAPFLCMTATASLKIGSKIIKLLNVRNPKLIRQSPDKQNISSHVEKAKELDETFKWILDLFSSSVAEIAKTIIYCRSLKDCGEIYSLFDEIATHSEAPVVSMYHSKTPEQIKQRVLSLSWKRMVTAALLSQQVFLGWV